MSAGRGRGWGQATIAIVNEGGARNGSTSDRPLEGSRSHGSLAAVWRFVDAVVVELQLVRSDPCKGVSVGREEGRNAHAQRREAGRQAWGGDRRAGDRCLPAPIPMGAASRTGRPDEALIPPYPMKKRYRVPSTAWPRTTPGLYGN